MGNRMIQNTHINHDGGSLNLEVEVDGDQVVLRFGSGFTLRVDESNLNKLREQIHLAAVELTLERQTLKDLKGKRFQVPKTQLIQEKSSKRESSKQSKRTKQQEVDLWQTPEEEEVTGHPV
jgi:hypothetical protein